MAKRQSVSQLVQNYIRDYIVNNKMNPGDQLPSEGDIAAELEVSRVSVREAVKVLQALGILDVRHGNGLFVRGLNFDALLDILSYSLLFKASSLKELYQVRKLFEAGMIPEVIQNIQQEHIDTCRDILKTWEENIEAGLSYREQDRLFHMTLCKSIGNNLLLELEKIFWLAYCNAEDRLPALRSLQVDPINMEGGLLSHVRILDAVEAKDADLAQRLLINHFSGIGERLEIVFKDNKLSQESKELLSEIFSKT